MSEIETTYEDGYVHFTSGTMSLTPSGMLVTQEASAGTTYEEYREAVAAQTQRDRDRFLGIDSHMEEPMYSADTGQVAFDYEAFDERWEKMLGSYVVIGPLTLTAPLMLELGFVDG